MMTRAVGFTLTTLLLTACQGGGSVSLVQNVRLPSNLQERSSSSCLTAACIYVLDAGEVGLRISPKVFVYPEDATGHANPIVLNCKKAGLSGSVAIAVDVNRQIYVTSEYYPEPSVAIYAPGATGDATPLETISGSNTGLATPDGIAVDSAGTIFVANEYGGPNKDGSVTVYASGSSGNVAPIRTIGGPGEYVGLAGHITVDSNDKLYVISGSSVNVFAPGASGNDAPLQRIIGAGVYSATGVAVDSVGQIYVTGTESLNGDGPYINVFAANANGNAVPIRTITGDLNNDTAIALDANANMYVTNLATGVHNHSSVQVYPAGANGRTKPIRYIKSGKPRLRNSNAIAVR
jgi:hypothetical protein